MLRALDHANEEAWEYPLFSYSLHQEHCLICCAHTCRKTFERAQEPLQCAGADAMVAYLKKKKKNRPHVAVDIVKAQIINTL